MKKLYAFLLYLLLTVSAYATDTYYCDTGDDSTGAGTKASPWQTYSKAIATLAAGSAGDNIYLCEGGEFAAVNTTIHTTCTANNPCSVTSYQPDDIDPADIGVKPHVVIDTSGLNKGIVFYSNAAYITVSNIHYQADAWTGTGTQTWGVWQWEAVSHITLDNLTIEDVAVGVNTSDSLDGNDTNNNLLIKNSRFINIWSVGILGSNETYTVINNYFDRNGSNGGGRPVYLGGTTELSVPNFAKDYLVAGNTIVNSAPSDIGNGDYAGVWVEGQYGCNRDPIGGHGHLINVTIKNNVLREDKTTAAAAPGGCWGYTIDTAWNNPDEYFENLVFQNNENYYAGNLMYGCSNCDGVVFRENIGYGINGGTGILAASRTEDTPHPTENIYVYYNLIVHEKVQTNGQLGVEGRHYVAAAVIADIQWNVFIYADNDAANKCTVTDSGSTVQNNFCFNVDSSGNFVVNTTYETN